MTTPLWRLTLEGRCCIYERKCVNVRELIEELSKLDPEAIVLTSDCCYGLDMDKVKVLPGRYYRERFAPYWNQSQWTEGAIYEYDDYDDADWEWWSGDEKPVPFNAVVID